MITAEEFEAAAQAWVKQVIRAERAERRVAELERELKQAKAQPEARGNGTEETLSEQAQEGVRDAVDSTESTEQGSG